MEFKEFLIERNLQKEILSQKHNPTPTENQIKSGKYAKPLINIGGLSIRIENPVGTIRAGTDPDGGHWETKFKNCSYGYIVNGPLASDHDKIDVFLANEDFQISTIWVVNQQLNGKFDEVKVLMGFINSTEAVKAYLSNYESGWEKNIMNVKELDTKTFKEWMKHGDTKKPIPYGSSIEI